MKSAYGFVVLYALFALIATLMNLGSQALFISHYHGIYSVEFSILTGTFVGLTAKYYLDKIYIFKFESDDLAHDAKLFVLYTAMGVATTLLFWGVEYSFDKIFKTDLMRYLGGFVGLAIGYCIKYSLDRRFVFIRCANTNSKEQAQ